LLLQDDPACLPDIALMPIDDDLLNLNISLAANESQLSSTPSIRTAQPGSLFGEPIGVLVLPSSQSDNIGGFALPGGDSVSRGPRPSSLFAREEEDQLLDLGFGFDAEGEIHDLPSADRTGAQLTGARPLLLDDGDPNERVRQEHAAGQGAGVLLPVSSPNSIRLE
jgi:meiotic recombination protein REC8, fungi type